MLLNARIPELPLNASLKNGYLAVVYNSDTDLTERFDIAALMPSATTGNFEYLSDTPYNNLDVVTFKGEWWQAIQSVPENIAPGTDPAYWTKINKSTSGFVFWKAGVYVDDQVFVLKDRSPGSDNSDIRLYRLTSLSRPYVSSDFDTELASGDWLQLFVSQPKGGLMISDQGDFTQTVADTYPFTGGSGPGGAPAIGNEFTVDAGGATFGGEVYPQGTILRKTRTGWKPFF